MLLIIVADESNRSFFHVLTWVSSFCNRKIIFSLLSRVINCEYLFWIWCRKAIRSSVNMLHYNGKWNSPSNTWHTLHSRCSTRVIGFLWRPLSISKVWELCCARVYPFWLTRNNWQSRGTVCRRTTLTHDRLWERDVEIHFNLLLGHLFPCTATQLYYNRSVRFMETYFSASRIQRSW